MVLTLLTEAVFKSNDCEQPTFRRSPPPDADSQSQMELVSTRSVEGSNNTALLHSMASNSQPLQNAARPGDRLCGRIQSLCKQDFRKEPWYLDNLRLLTCVSIAVMPVIIPFGALRDHGGLTMILLVSVPAIFGLVASIVIPVCGIVSSIQHRPLSRHSSFIIGLAIYPKYQVPRWIFFLSWAAAAWLASNTTLYTFGFSFGVPVLVMTSMTLVHLAALIFFAVFFYAVVFGLFYIYSQVLA